MTTIKDFEYSTTLNEKPMSEKELSEKALFLAKKEEIYSKSGTVSGNYYYPADHQHRKFVENNCNKFMYANPLHFDQCLGPIQVEKEIISYMKHFFNGNEETYGTVTSGGTESIFLAAYALREHARRIGIDQPEIITNQMAHAAIFKACYYLNMKIIIIKTDHLTGMCSSQDLINKMNSNTIGFYLSGINYATGIVDQVGEINNYLLGKKNNSDPVNEKIKKKFNHIGIIVDSCLGGYMTATSAYLNDGRFPIIDFRLRKVFAITSDPHKYGQGPKGCSVVLFKNIYLKRCSTFMLADWTGGIYGTPTITGSRSALPSVGSWLSLKKLGMEGIIKCYKQITECIDHLKIEINGIPELYVIGNPKGCSIAFTVSPTFSKKFNIMILNDLIKKKYGFSMSICNHPISIHISITMNNVKKIRESLSNGIKECMKDYRENQSKYSKMENSNIKLYGTLVSVPKEFSQYVFEHVFAFIGDLQPMKK